MLYRWAATAAYGALAAAYFIGTQFAVDLRPELLDELWYSWGPLVALLVLAAALGFVIGRWVVAVGALGPLAAAVPLHLSGHMTPWHHTTRPLETAPHLSALLAAITLAAVFARKRLGPRQRWSALDESWSR